MAWNEGAGCSWRVRWRVKARLSMLERVRRGIEEEVNGARSPMKRDGGKRNLL